MKKIILPFLICFTSGLLSQNYKLFPSFTDTLSFEGIDGLVNFISFDSIHNLPAQNIYFSHRETHYSDDIDSCLGQIYGPAWAADKIVEANGAYIFKHTDYEFRIDINDTHTVPDSIGWLSLSYGDFTLKSVYNGVTQCTLYNGYTDSVKTYIITAIDTNGAVHSTSQPLLIEVSKNYGLTAIPFFNYNSYQFIFSNLKRIEYHLLSRREIYDFDSGDQFHFGSHYSPMSQPWGGPPAEYDNFTILNKTTIGGDSVSYQVWHVWDDYQLNSQTLQMEHKIFKDTAYLNYGKLDELIGDKFTFQSDTLSYYSFRTSLWHTDIMGVEGLKTEQNKYDRIGTCIRVPFEPPIMEYSYGKGLGMIKFFHADYAAMSFIEERLLYYKKADGTTYGKPFYISVEEDFLSGRKHSFYPNPADHTLYFEWPSHVGQLAVKVYLNGILLKTAVLSVTNNQMDISDLPAGIYLLKSGSGSSRLVKL